MSSTTEHEGIDHVPARIRRTFEGHRPGPVPVRNRGWCVRRPDFDYLGVDGSTVYTIGDDAPRRSSAICPIRKFDQKDAGWRHTMPYSGLMAEHTVLPMAFGLLADGPEAVRRILRVNHDAIAEQLERISRTRRDGLPCYVGCCQHI